MKRFNPSLAALALAAVALFASFGGPAWAAGLISGSQIKNGSITGNKLKNGSITSRKIGKGQVQAANLAVGAVNGSNVAHGSLTGSQIAPGSLTGTDIAPGSLTGTDIAPGSLTGTDVAPGSLTASDVAPNTFLAANGTATNASALGGLPASSFVHGAGSMIQRRLDIPFGTPPTFLLDTGLGEVDGSCLAGHAEVSFTAEAQPLNFIEWGFTSGGSPDVNLSNSMVIGSTYSEPNPSGQPQAIDFQAAQSFNNSPSRVATVWTTDQAVGGTDCVFTSQSITTGA